MYEKSKALYEKAKDLMPGGVNSPVRAFNSVGMDPVFIDHGKDARTYDVDGNEYIDYVLSFGPLILGHSDRTVVEALTAAAQKGTSFGAPTDLKMNWRNSSSNAYLQSRCSAWSLPVRKRRLLH